MRSARGTGRIIGVLLFLQLAGLIVPFALLQSARMGTSEFLANAAENSFRIRAAVLLLFANCALTIGISIAALPVFRRAGEEALALWLAAASLLVFALQAVDNTHLLSMLSLSQQYAQAGSSSSGSAELFQTLAAAAVGSTRRWAHFTELLVIDCWMFLLYGLLYRSALVPRSLAAFGLATVLLHFAGIPLPAFLGYDIVMLMAPPMGLSQLALALWLVTRGFDERVRGTNAEFNLQ